MDDKEIVEVTIRYRDGSDATFQWRDGFKIAVKISYVSEVQPDTD